MGVMQNPCVQHAETGAATRTDSAPSILPIGPDGGGNEVSKERMHEREAWGEAWVTELGRY